MEPVDSPSGELADIFETRVAVEQRSFPKSELPPGVKADGICFARVYRSGEIVCERENHKQHGFGQYLPAEVATMAATVLRQRFAVEPGGRPQLDWRLANRPDLWMYIDELPGYIRIAKDSNVEGYLMHRVPPKLVEVWAKRGIEDATEILWADVIYDEMKGVPMGYIGAVVQVLGRLPIDVCRLAKGDHEITKKLIWAVENKRLWPLSVDLVKSGGLDRLPDIGSEWVKPMGYPHVVTLKSKLWVPPPSIVCEVAEEEKQMELGL